MTYQLAVPLSQGSDDVVIFEVDSAEVPDDLVLASDDPARKADRARVTLEEALTNLKPSLKKIREMLQDLSPDETTVNFGLKIGGEYGVVIAKGTAEVNFSVEMSWKSD
jgi:hypothetical protein